MRFYGIEHHDVECLELELQPDASPTSRPTFSPNAFSVPRISFSSVTRLVRSVFRLVSRRRSSWLSAVLTCTAVNQPTRIAWAIARASFRSVFTAIAAGAVEADSSTEERVFELLLSKVDPVRDDPSPEPCV